MARQDRGTSAASGPDRRSTANRRSPPRAHVTSAPSTAKLSAGQRLRSGTGGSATIRRPHGSRNGSPHSAVTGGGAKERAVTTSNSSRKPACLAATSARPLTTSIRPDQPSRATASASSEARRLLDSRSTPVLSGQNAASTSPGTPPPLPRSKKRGGELAPMTSAKPSEWRTCSSTSPGPKTPRALARARALATPSRSGGITTRGGRSPPGVEAPHLLTGWRSHRSRSPYRAPPCDRLRSSAPRRSGRRWRAHARPSVA